MSVAKPKATVTGPEQLIPREVGEISDPQRDLPRIAKDESLVADIQRQAQSLPTEHRFVLGDARAMDWLEPKTVHLVLTSPPYWTLKQYRTSIGQMGDIANHEDFLRELDRVWRHCFRALVPGGRLIVVVGDVCLSRRKNGGRHTVVPLHAAIQERCRTIGFDNLAPIIWHKIANASYEVERGSGGFLGKPFEPNAAVKNDIEFVLMQRKPGGYRQPDVATRILSVLSAAQHGTWFQQIWTGLTGASTREHPAPYPVELAQRLIRMFSFAGDTVLDPFVGSGTTMVAAGLCGRSSIGVEVDPHYIEQAKKRVERELLDFFSFARVVADGDAKAPTRRMKHSMTRDASCAAARLGGQG